MVKYALMPVSSHMLSSPKPVINICQHFTTYTPTNMETRARWNTAFVAIALLLALTCVAGKWIMPTSDA